MKLKAQLQDFDLFQQTVDLKVRKESRSLPSWAGLICSFWVVVLSLAYTTLRLDILINHGS
jgi:hypothetical protein